MEKHSPAPSRTRDARAATSLTVDSAASFAGLPARRPSLEHCRRLLLVAIAGLLAAFPTGPASGFPGGSSSASDLARLEIKFFMHDFPCDTDEDRLRRLEKMVFGSQGTGAPGERLSRLLKAVPNLDPYAVADENSLPVNNRADTARPPAASEQPRRAALAPHETYSTPPRSSSYPAVTAIERRLFGRDFTQEPIRKRLDRLETRVFSQPSQTDDLLARVDRLKERTNVDVTASIPAGADLSAEDEDEPAVPPRASIPAPARFGPAIAQRRSPGLARGGIPSGAPGRWSSQASPPMAPDFRRRRPPVAATPPYAPPSYRPAQTQPWLNRAPGPAPQSNLSGAGLIAQVGSLEIMLFGRTFPYQPLPTRVDRLESTVFPGSLPPLELPLNERVTRLSRSLPTAQRNSLPHLADGVPW